MEHASHPHSSGTAKSYLTGFVLAIVLTAIPFGLVMYPDLPRSWILTGIVVFAVVQILVHLVYFLHLNASADQSLNVLSFLFTVIVIALVVGGSVWIMINIADNMMAS